VITTMGWAILVMGMLVLLVAAVGVLRLPDALARQHAATKAGTLAVSLCVVGLAVLALANGWGWSWIGRLLLLQTVLLVTLPIASHALARAGLSEMEKRDADP